MKLKTPKNKRSKIKPINKRFNFLVINHVAQQYDLIDTVYIKAGMLYNKPLINLASEIILSIIA